jgi:hypothetical protein
MVYIQGTGNPGLATDMSFQLNGTMESFLEPAALTAVMNRLVLTTASRRRKSGERRNLQDNW